MANDNMTKAAFAARLVDEYRPTDRGSQLDTGRLRDIVASDLDMTAAVFPVLIQAAIQDKLAIWGLLAWIAKVFKDATGGDNSLIVALEAEAKRANISLPKILEAKPSPGASPSSPERPKKVLIEVATSDLVARSAFRIASIFDLDSMDPAARSRVVGNCFLTFPVDADPRPVWRIPEIREFMADLHQRIPHFPLTLDFTPDHGMFMTYYGPLVEERAVKPQGNAWLLDPDDPSVRKYVAESIHAVRAESKRLGLPISPTFTMIINAFSP